MSVFVRVLAVFLAVQFASPGVAQVLPGRHSAAFRAPYTPAAEIAPRAVVRHRAMLGTPVRRWNEIAINASGLDHTPPQQGENRTHGEQLGPCRAARAMAIVHLAIFEVVNCARATSESYLGRPQVGTVISLDAGIAQAAHDCLAALFPAQSSLFAGYLAEDLALMRPGPAKIQGIDLGQSIAAAVLALRENDGSDHDEPRVGIEHITANAPGRWRQDPVSGHPLALGASWPQVTPFVLSSGSQFRLPPPPALDSLEYSMAYVEVKRLGGDGVTTPTERTEEESFIGVFWAYDGTPSLCAPPRLYNQIALAVAAEKRTTEMELARLLALVNLAMADAAIAAWDSKYHHDFWRPVTGIREGGPDAPDDGNEDTVGNPSFMPLGAPASNLTGPNFTPPFPAYPSGHATFGGALFQVLRRFYGTDQIPFTFVSDEFNGVTLDNNGQPRPLRPRTFSSLSQAEEENARSRIYLGIHWDFDAYQGVKLGRQVGDYVFDHACKLKRPPRR